MKKKYNVTFYAAEERFCRKEVADLYFSTLEEAQQTFDLLPFMATNICEAEMHEYDANLGCYTFVKDKANPNYVPTHTERKENTDMTIHEFEELTGFYPSTDLYSAIEQAYDDYPGDKREFCAEYKANKDGLAEKIQYTASLNTINALSAETAKANEAKLERDDAKRKIKELEAALEKAQGWKKYGTGSHMTDADYLDLEKRGEPITEERAKEIIHKEFGFAIEFIEIINELAEYEVNHSHQLRETGKLSRLPHYESTDWNYIRFNVNGWQYEMVDGQLEFFDV